MGVFIIAQVVTVCILQSRVDCGMAIVVMRLSQLLCVIQQWTFALRLYSKKFCTHRFFTESISLCRECCVFLKGRGVFIKHLIDSTFENPIIHALSLYRGP
jgi:hypothetical protein